MNFIAVIIINELDIYQDLKKKKNIYAEAITARWDNIVTVLT